jgi:hypothetical protein
MRRAKVVGPAHPQSILPARTIAPEAPDSERRRSLARWLADPENPLSSRVLVNRIWHHHFGRGIVSTPGDFGFQGESPSHPELLDWLALEFRATGGHLKPIHRLILNSATYRQSGRIDPKAVAIDKDNRLLWRNPTRRIDAESLRDAILAVSGVLDQRMGGPGYTVWKNNTNYVVVFKPLEILGPAADRRMIHQFKPRSQEDPTFGAFDCPDASQVVARRNVSTTALQALNLFNSRFVVDRAAAFARRVEREAGPSGEAGIRRSFRLAYGREPEPAELAGAKRLVEVAGMPGLGRAIFNSNEFLYAR